MQKWLSRCLLLPLLVLGPMVLVAQDDAFNLDLVAQEEFHDHQFDPRKPQYLFAKSKWYLKYNPVTGVFGGMMYVYQRYISQQISAECLYHTSCSRFSVKAIREYGMIKGLALSADRLMRCNQVAAAGIHPSTLHDDSHRVVDPIENYQLKDY